MVFPGPPGLVEAHLSLHENSDDGQSHTNVEGQQVDLTGVVIVWSENESLYRD